MPKDGAKSTGVTDVALSRGYLLYLRSGRNAVAPDPIVWNTLVKNHLFVEVV